MRLTVYLSGEIHSPWRDEIRQGISDANLPIEVLQPETDHEMSDNVGANVLGREDSSFWKDYKSASINNVRIKNGIEKADIVVVKFGEKYRQWNAAYDAGFAVAKGKSVIVIQPNEFDHALKEVNAQVAAVARTHTQVVDILKYICRS